MQWLTDFCDKLEAKFGVNLSALIMSVLLILLASIYVTPALHSVQLGVMFEKLSVEPFNFAAQNPLQYRILTPLIAHFLFLRGKLYILMPLISGILFLTSVYIYFRKRQRYTSLDSLLVTALMAFSSPILHPLRFQGYVDTTTCLLIFLCLVLSEKKSYFWYFFFALGLLNHESILFMSPVFMWLHNKQFKLKRAILSVLFLGLSFIPAILYRSYVSMYTPVEYSPHFYVGIENIKHIIYVSYRMAALGIFMAFKLFWAMPIYAIIKSFKDNKFDKVKTISLIILCTLIQLLFSSDVSRVIGFGFLAIIVGVKYVKEYWSDAAFSKGLLILISFNFIVPQYYVGQEAASPFFMLPISALCQFFGFNWRIYF